MKMLMRLWFLLSLCSLSSYTLSKMVPYEEDIYLSSAPDEVVHVVQGAVEKMKFSEDYEVMVPKKAGIQINPWNAFISSGRNPKTKNIFLIINPEWFFKLPQDEQQFLIVHALLKAPEGEYSQLVIGVSLIFFILSIALIVLFTFLLGKIHITSHMKRWLRLTLAFGIMFLLNIIVMNKVQQKILEYLTIRHKVALYKKAMILSGSTMENALHALMRFDEIIKKGIQSGDSFWKPFEHAIEQQIDGLQK